MFGRVRMINSVEYYLGSRMGLNNTRHKPCWIHLPPLCYSLCVECVFLVPSSLHLYYFCSPLSCSLRLFIRLVFAQPPLFFHLPMHRKLNLTNINHTFNGSFIISVHILLVCGLRIYSHSDSTSLLSSSYCYWLFIPL